MQLKISILGTRGIPNNYGGYEQAAAFISEGLVNRGHNVTVYNSHNHPYQQQSWKDVNIVHCYDPEYKTGTMGQFLYDLNCIRHARKHPPDVLLLFGYTSSSVWGKWYPKNSVVISNMDGLEWKRTKYNKPVRKFLQYAEKLAVKHSHHYIADSVAIQEYLQNKYDIKSQFIPYGACIASNECEKVLSDYEVSAYNYDLLIARMEPENNIEMIINGCLQSNSEKKLLIIGNAGNTYGKKLQQRYANEPSIIFAGPLFDQQKLHSLRFFCSIYFHGHTVGGTNPSLLEAMASKALVAAHDNPFNRGVLGDDALYFSAAPDIARLNYALDENAREHIICSNLKKINRQYNWDAITNQYEEFIIQCYNARQ